MNIEDFIKAIGGRQSVIAETGLTKGRISQWVIENSIPKAWVKYFMSKYPDECEAHGIKEASKKAA